VAADQLRIGLHVHVDLPWFRHPFTFNSFRIDNDEQLRQLRALGEPRFRCDPEQGGVTDVPTPAASFVETVETPAAPVEAPPPELAGASGGDRDRLRLLQKHRLRIGQVNQSFLKSTAILRHLERDLTADPTAALREIGGLVDQMAPAFLEHPEVTLHLMGERSGSEDSYAHRLNITVLSMMVARELGLSPGQTHLLGLGALLHDIGAMDAPERPRPRPVRPGEDREHSLRVGKELGLPDEVLTIILQHQEMVDGSGHPLGLKGDEIVLSARIVSLVNYYEKLCNPDDPMQAMTPHETLSLMFGRERGKFDTAALERLIRCLGVYPPGSIVSLSNDATALVISVNPARPLRPWVMVYDQHVPREEAILLDLEGEPGINIVGALRPVMLPPAVAAYLSTRQRMIYYFDSDARPERKGGA
jgi:hypothetical protein